MVLLPAVLVSLFPGIAPASSTSELALLEVGRETILNVVSEYTLYFAETAIGSYKMFIVMTTKTIFRAAIVFFIITRAVNAKTATLAYECIKCPVDNF